MFNKKETAFRNETPSEGELQNFCSTERRELSPFYSHVIICGLCVLVTTDNTNIVTIGM
jgi:hypothetical protein